MKKAFLSILIVILAVAISACGTNSNDPAVDSSAPANTEKETNTETNTEPEAPQEKVTILITNSKGEITSQWEQAAKDFMVANPNITVKARSSAVGDTLSILDKLTASGEVVTLAMVDPSAASSKYKDMGIDLTSEKWNEETKDGFKNASGQIVGFPFAIEGFGLVYNIKVVEKAVGGSFDPFSINTRDKLKELLDKIKASGVKYPTAFQTEAWSVSNHYSTQFLNQVENGGTIVTQLSEGTFDLASNDVWNGYYDTLDMLTSLEYNKFGERPLGVYYDEAHLAVGKGESALLFNGNWAFDSLKAVAGDSFGFIPVPVDNNADNPLNNKIVAGPTQLLLINNKATPAEQDAAKKFLNWLVYDEVGQDFIVNKSQIISAFKNNPNKVTNPLGAAIADAIVQGKTSPFSTSYVLAEDWHNIIAPDVQKYLIQKVTRADLAKAIQTYYINKK